MVKIFMLVKDINRIRGARSHDKMIGISVWITTNLQGRYNLALSQTVFHMGHIGHNRQAAMPMKNSISVRWARLHDTSMGDHFDSPNLQYSYYVSRMILHMGQIGQNLHVCSYIISVRWAHKHDKSMGISFWFTKLTGYLKHGIISNGAAHESNWAKTSC